MKTQEEIANLMNKLNKWGLLDGLTKREKESIETDLKHIAGTAVMEAHRKTKDILPSFYNELTQRTAQ